MALARRNRKRLASVAILVATLWLGWSFPDGSAKHRGPWQAFDEAWFATHQRPLLSWVNSSSLVRGQLCIDLPMTTRVNYVGPNRVVFGAHRLPNGRVEATTDFRTHWKWSKRVWNSGRPFWLLGALAREAVKPVEASTLTSYPDPNPESTTVDGYVYKYDGTEFAWATLHNAATGNAASDTANEVIAQVECGPSTPNTYDAINRSILLFNTASLGASATVSAATLSIYGSRKATGLSGTYDVYTSTPNSNTAVSTADYSHVGTTSQSGAPISIASWSLTGYNAFAFDATGVATVQAARTTVCKLGFRNANYDAGNVAPTWNAGASDFAAGFSADQTGTASDPQLLVTYSVPSTFNGLDLAGN